MKFLVISAILWTWVLVLTLFGEPHKAMGQDVPRIFSLGTEITTSTNTVNPSDEDYSASLDLELRPSFKLPRNYSVKGVFSGSKELTDERKSKVNDGFLSGTKEIFNHKDIFSVTGETRIYLPLDEVSRRENSLLTRIYLSPIMSLDLQKILLEGLSFTYIPYYSRDFHRFETTVSGNSNTQQTLANIFVLSYAPIEKLSLDFIFLYGRSWTYQGTRRNDKFRLAQEASYALPQQWKVGIGHINEGSALAADGVNSNVRLYQNNSSSVYVMVSKIF